MTIGFPVSLAIRYAGQSGHGLCVGSASPYDVAITQNEVMHARANLRRTESPFSATGKTRLLGAAEDLKKFMEENKSRLKLKDQV